MEDRRLQASNKMLADMQLLFMEEKWVETKTALKERMWFPTPFQARLWEYYKEGPVIHNSEEAVMEYVAETDTGESLKKNLFWFRSASRLND